MEDEPRTAAIYIAAAAVVLNSVLALPVTGIVATSGVVAIVLGLALQSTLADVFSGIAVGIEAPFGTDMLRQPAPRAVLTRLGQKRNVYEVSFFVARTNQLATTKHLLLRGARRQLYYRGFLDKARDQKPGARAKNAARNPHMRC